MVEALWSYCAGFSDDTSQKTPNQYYIDPKRSILDSLRAAYLAGVSPRPGVDETFTPNRSTTPELATTALMGIGLALLPLDFRRFKSQSV
jgi:hypothetical protein